MYDMSVEDFLDNTTQHLFGNHVDTEFSSWSASPRFVLHYATSERESAYVAVIDTSGLRESTGNSMFHVPALAPIFEDPIPGRCPKYALYDWEYLVHGVIEGRHYKAVSFQSLCDAGLTNHLPPLREYVNAWGSDKFPLPELIVPFSKGELDDLDRIAELFGPRSQMRTAITITLFCCKKRAGFGTELREDELKEIVQHLGGRNNVDDDWCASLWNDVYDPRYEDNKQMVNVMRAVSTYCWGRGARARFANKVDADLNSFTGDVPSAYIHSLMEPGAGSVANFKPLATMNLIGMMILAVLIHFFRNPTATGWLVVIYCLYWDIRGIRSWLLRLAAEYMDPAV
ncbi:hypothetical protein KCU98_g6393, partial [Aureobasidium melanogenum]